MQEPGRPPISKTNHRSVAQSVYAVAIATSSYLLLASRFVYAVDLMLPKARPLLMLSSGCRNLGSCKYKSQQEEQERVQNARQRNLKLTHSE